MKMKPSGTKLVCLSRVTSAVDGKCIQLDCAILTGSSLLWKQIYLWPFNLTKWDGRPHENAYNVIWPDRMSECSRYDSLMCDCQADVTSWGIWGMVAALTDCHLVQSSDCQSLARPHSFPHQDQDHQGWLWLPLVISCRVIILHISHRWQLFLLVREDEMKALSLSSATTNTPDKPR